MAALTAAVAGVRPAGAQDGEPRRTTRVSVSTQGVGGVGESDGIFPVMTPDGRFVAFSSHAPNLVAGDTNAFGYFPYKGGGDIFVHDRDPDEDGRYDEIGAVVTERVSVATGGAAGHGHWQASDHPSISADGRYVAFDSDNPDLAPGDRNGTQDIFVHDRYTRRTVRVSVSSGGQEGNDTSEWPSISGDGRYVAFHSYATNLATGDTNRERQVYVHDLHTRVTERVSIDSTGETLDISNHVAESPQAMSYDGRYVTFYSIPGPGDSAIYVRDRVAGTTVLVSVGPDGQRARFGSIWRAHISWDGCRVAFQAPLHAFAAEGPGGNPQAWVRDWCRGWTRLVSVSDAGRPADSAWPRSISPDGRYVAFVAGGTLLDDPDPDKLSAGNVYVRDLEAARTWRISVPFTGSGTTALVYSASVGADARHVAYSALSPLNSPGAGTGWDVFVSSPDQPDCYPAVGCLPR